MRSSPGDCIRVALIGFGHGGEVFHAPLVDANPDLRLVTIVTSDPERQGRARARYPQARVVDRVEDLWDRVDDHDLVIVCTPNVHHVPLATAALEAGRAVVVDKPLAASAADGRALADLADRRGLLLTAFQNRRWDGDFLAIRGLLDRQELGRVIRFESRFERWVPGVRDGAWRERGAPEEGGGVLLDLGSHLVDQALQLFGRPSHVYGEVGRRRPGAEVDDEVFMALTHSGEVRSHVWASMTTAAEGPRFRVLGLEGGVETFGQDPQERKLAGGAGPGGWGAQAEEWWGRISGGAMERNLAIEPGNYPAFYVGLVAALRSGGPPPVDVRDAIEGLEVLEAVRESSRRGEVVVLEPKG
jgi:scyllo-inositol 2-dehydrogenase (NADP+)